MPISAERHDLSEPWEIPAPILAAKVDQILDTELSPLGFERIRPRYWVESRDLPIRRLFDFQPLKGARYSARWGFSLGFVPLCMNGRLRWKRTPKTARFDLCIDPIDSNGRVPDWCSLSRSRYPANHYDWERVLHVTTDGVMAARPDFDRVKSIKDILALFRERSAMKFRRFSLESYIQTHIAWGLSLIAIGEPEEGERHLQIFCTRFSIDRVDPILRQAEQEAMRAAQPVGRVSEA